MIGCMVWNHFAQRMDEIRFKIFCEGDSQSLRLGVSEDEESYGVYPEKRKSNYPY